MDAMLLTLRLVVGLLVAGGGAVQPAGLDRHRLVDAHRDRPCALAESLGHRPWI